MVEFESVLIADSGATKTDWVLLSSDASGNNVASFSGPGVSPLHHSEDAIIAALRQVANTFGDSFSRIRFYGAGIGTPLLESQMKYLLGTVFNSADIEVATDMLGAAKALYGSNPGIACIMGTGSNSCHYDGSRIDMRSPSLGYLLDDDGGGVAFGRRLLADIFKKTAPVAIQKEFHESYSLTREDLIRHLYKQPSPNRWIASFFPFIAGHEDDPYISDLIDSQIERFISREFAAYPEKILKKEEIGFVGSVAEILKPRLQLSLKSRGWRVGNIIRKPIENINNLSS